MKLSFRACLLIALVLIAASFSIPPVRVFLERSMFLQMVIQIPMLFIGGALLSGLARPAVGIPIWRYINLYGLSGFMMAQMILLYWMLPISIDRAVVFPLVDLVKICTILIAGLLVGESLQKSPSALQLFFIGYFIAMLAWLGYYFVTTEFRLCNAYSLSSQQNTGYGLIGLDLITFALWSFNILQQKTRFSI
jgi:hypothetical protein